MKNLSLFSTVLAAISAANAYFLVGHSNILVTERLDPIVNPGVVSPHVHTIQGGSNFGSTLSTAQLRKSSCSTVPIKEDKSNYWVPQLYFQWKNGTVSSLTGGMVTYYLFDNQPGKTTAFPDDFRMISGDTTLRTYNASSFAQQAVTFLCLDFQGTSTRYNQLPRGISCPSGIRSQINFPSCWDGKNVDSPDHKSHVSYLSTGPDSGSCTDPKFPVTLPRIFLEFYWDAQDWESHRQDALDPQQPFVFSNGDATGYGYHADFFNGWDEGVLQRVVDGCHCNDFGDPTCCSDAGLFTFEKNPAQCTIPSTVSENVLGSFAKLPGNNLITGGVVAQPGSASTGGEGTPASVTLKGGAQPTASAPAASAPAASAPAASAPAASAPAASAPAASAPAASAPAASAPAASAPASSGNGAGGVMATSGNGSSSNSNSNGSSPSNSNSNGSSSSSSGTASTSSSSNSGTSSNSGSTPASSGPGSSNSGSTSTSSSGSGSGSGSSKTCKPRASRRGLNNTTTRSKFRNHKMAVRRLTERGMVH